MHTMLIAIDTGANGGVAYMDRDGNIHADHMPEGMTSIIDYLRSLAILAAQDHDHTTTVFIENVGGYMPKNSATAAVKFARHCGHVEAACYCLALPVIKVAPQTWMKATGTLPRDKGDRKRAIKELMQRRYPHLRVTLATADALAILTYAINHQG